MNVHSNPSDSELVVRCLAGEKEAFGYLMQRYKEQLYRFIRRYAGDRDEAYDILQESFLAAWHGLKHYDQSKPFPAWLFRIALNKCRDWSRRRTVRRWLTHSDPLDGFVGLALIDNNPLPDTATIEKQELLLLDQAIASLPKNLKEPLILTALQGHTHSEAAVILKLSAKAIEVRVYRARKALAEKLRLLNHNIQSLEE
ncbi:MAG: RNA polymerase sigma factor [Alphaproteobacteria bacterium]